MRSDARRRRREGAIAVQFAMLAFGFFAIAAAVIDMRLAMHAQQQMQVAADTASVEALRQRDAFGSPAVLRDVARNAVEVAFDDDLDPDNGDTMNCGAGPLLKVTGGRAESNALALLSIASEKVYDPILRFNDVNKKHGDIVTGRYVDPYPARSTESTDYTRNDFLPAAVPDLTTPQESVLVRIRRTSEAIRPNPLDRETNVSSAGPTLPFLFGLGTSIHARTTGSGYNPRTEGLTVRATAIASARRAMQISGPGTAYGQIPLQRFGIICGDIASPYPPPTGQFPPSGSPPTGGQHLLTPAAKTGPPHAPPPLAPSDLFDDAWQVLTAGNPAADTISVVFELSTGHMRRPVGSPAPRPILGFASRLLGTDNDPTTLVGQVADRKIQFEILLGETIVPILRPVEDYFVVIGFGFIGVGDAGDADPMTFTITKLPAAVQPVGANAVAPDALRIVTQIPTLQFAHTDFTGAVLTPVLER